MKIPGGIVDFMFYLAPSLLVFGTAWWLIRSFMRRESALRVLEQKSRRERELLPLRLQAYERMTLYLERISPSALLEREYEDGLTVAEFRFRLISAIRSEFEHNLAQQIYVSAPLWGVISSAKEEVVGLVLKSSSSLEPGLPATVLSKSLLGFLLESKENPTQRAIDILKSEVAQLF